MNNDFKFCIFENDEICNKMKKYKSPYETFILYILFCLNEKKHYKLINENTDNNKYELVNSNIKSYYFDIGGFIGDTSIFLKDYYDKIFVFEPSIKIYQKLEKNLLLNNTNNIFINNKAVGNIFNFQINIETDLENIITNEGDRLLHYGATKQVNDDNLNSSIAEKCDVITMANFINSLNDDEILNSKNQLIFKIDIEGYEYNAIEGFDDLLEKDLIIIYEYNERQLKNKSIVSKLKKYGYLIVIYIHHNNYMVM